MHILLKTLQAPTTHFLPQPCKLPHSAGRTRSIQPLTGSVSNALFPQKLDKKNQRGHLFLFRLLHLEKISLNKEKWIMPEKDRYEIRVEKFHEQKMRNVITVIFV